MPKKIPTTWIVVADGMRARFFSWNDATKTLAPAIGFDLFAPDVQGHARDLGRREPGRAFSAGSNGRRHMFEPRHDYHKLAKHIFATAVANALDEALARSRFDRLVIAAPRRSLGEMRGLLSARVKRTLHGEIAKDLTRASATELKARLRTYFAPEW